MYVSQTPAPLQPANVALQTINLRLTEKVEVLNTTNEDLRDSLGSTQIATIFPGRDMIVSAYFGITLVERSFAHECSGSAQASAAGNKVCS